MVRPISIKELLGAHMKKLSSPVLRTIYVQRSPVTDALPDAGETALSARSELTPPPIVQKAISRPEAQAWAALELLAGELPDQDMAQIQVWRYGPLLKDTANIDDVSLALSIADITDERAEAAIGSLFGKEYPWREAL